MNLFINFFRYERFVVALEEASKDMLPVLKDKALKVSLLFSSPSTDSTLFAVSQDDCSLFSSIVIPYLLGFLISQSTLHEHNYSCTFYQITDNLKMGSG